jgi:hypothetical protein
MFKLYYRIKVYVVSIIVLIFISKLSAYASPPDSSITQDARPPSLSFKRIKSLLSVAPAPSVPAKIEDKEIADPSGLFSKFLSGLQTGGYYRAYFWSREMPTPYLNPGGASALGTNKVMNIGDGNYDPMLLMYVGGTPTANTSLGTELILASPFDAYLGPAAGTRTFNSYYNMVLRGNTNTKLGNFGIIAGGIQWTQLSPFTFGANVGYQRYSIWERRPWDPGGNVNTRYSSYYYSGTINQDQRFGTQAFKGFIVQGNSMPFNTSFDFFYGKTAINGGFDREAITVPKSNIGGRITKDLKNNNKIALNTFSSFARTDSVNNFKPNVHWSIFTTEFNFNHKGFNINGEAGYGGYASPNYKQSWGEGLIVNLITPKKYTILPFSLRYFQINKSFTSNVAQFSNTSIQEVNSGFLSPGAYNLSPFGGNMSQVGDLNNNRRGVAINTEVKIWKFKLIAGTQIESELSTTGNKNIITYSHRINSLTWSRLPAIFPYLSGMGPNGRVKTVYRGAYEIVNINDNINKDSTGGYRRSYNSLDLQIKFKTKIFNKDFYAYNLNTVESVQGIVQGKLINTPAFFGSTSASHAYITTRYHELEMYYHLRRDLIVSAYGGLEIVKGSKYTDLTTAATGVNGVAGLTRNQIGKGLGIGADFSISSNTSIYIRQRWFSFNDRSFAGEQFRGHEATIELKIFF